MRPGSKTSFPIVFYVLCSLFLVFADSRGFLEPVHTLVQAIFVPVQSSLYRGKLKLLEPLEWVREVREAGKVREEIQNRNAFLESQVAQIGSLQAENAHLKELVGSTLPGTWSYEPAKVVSVGVDTLEILENESRESWGNMGGRVIVTTQKDAKSGIFIGRIGKVTGRVGEVSLPTKVNTKITVTVKSADNGEKRASGVLEGKGDRAIIDQVLTGETLKEGDLVVSSGDQNTPPDLLIGYVGKILQVREASFQQAELKAPVNYRKLEEVFVVTKF